MRGFFILKITIPLSKFLIMAKQTDKKSGPAKSPEEAAKDLILNPTVKQKAKAEEELEEKAEADRSAALAAAGGDPANAIPPAPQEPAKGDMVEGTEGPGLYHMEIDVIPTDEQLEEIAQQFAVRPEMMGFLNRIHVRANEIAGLAALPALKTAEELAAVNYGRLVKQYGSDFVTAKRKGNTRYFTRKTWNAYGANKQGWEIFIPEMPEVTEAKAAAEKE